MRNVYSKVICLIMILALAAGLSSCAASAKDGIVQKDGYAAQPAEDGELGGIKLSMQVIPFKAGYYRVAWRERSGEPGCYLFSDSKSLSDYYLAQKSYSIEEAKQDISRYDDEWFKDHQLIVAVIDEGSGSVSHRVLSVTKGIENRVIIYRFTPSIGTCDMASWRIFIETDKVFSPDDRITVDIKSFSATEKIKDTKYKDVDDALAKMTDDEMLCVNIYFPEPSEEKVLARMKEEDPEAYRMYVWAKYNDPTDPQEEHRKLVEEALKAGKDPEDVPWVDPIDDSILQRGIELKRQLCSEMTHESVQQIFGRYFSTDDIAFQSSYSGMLTADLTKDQILEIKQKEPGITLELNYESEVINDIDELIEWLDQ